CFKRRRKTHEVIRTTITTAQATRQYRNHAVAVALLFLGILYRRAPPRCGGLSIPATAPYCTGRAAFHSSPLWNSANADQDGEHFSPSENLERLELDHLKAAAEHARAAKRPLDIAIYAFTDRILADLLVREAEQGTVIRIYRDGEQYENEERNAARFRNSVYDADVPRSRQCSRARKASFPQRSDASEGLVGRGSIARRERELVAGGS